MGKKSQLSTELKTSESKRKLVDEVLLGNKEGYRELAESISDVFFAMDRNLRYIYWNKASEELTGVKAEDALGKSIFEVFSDTEDTRRAVAMSVVPKPSIRGYDLHYNWHSVLDRIVPQS